MALCAGYPPVTGGFPLQMACKAGFDVLFDGQINRRVAGDWRSHTAHCDVIVMEYWNHTCFEVKAGISTEINRVIYGQCNCPFTANIIKFNPSVDK